MWINENTPYKGSYLPRANHSCFVLATSENEDLKQESKTAFVLVVLCSYVCIHSTALVLLLFLVFKSETLGDILLKNGETSTKISTKFCTIHAFVFINPLCSVSCRQKTSDLKTRRCSVLTVR